MDEFLNHLNMFFHPYMDIHKHHLQEEKIIQRNHIKILTYNIFVRPPLIKNNENDWKDERLADFISLLEEYDIICLQEMFGNFSNRKQELIKYANKSGLFFFVDSPSPSFFSKFVIDGGLLILSRFPIIESEFRPFRYSVLADSLANKGILYAKIKIKDSYLMVFNTHTQASYFGSSSYHWNISVQTRLDQIEELCYFIKEVIDSSNMSSDTTVILMGDLNVDAHNYHRKKQTVFEFSPFTFGYNGENLKHYDRCLTAKEDIGSFQTLDYIFELKFNKNALIEKNNSFIVLEGSDKKDQKLITRRNSSISGKNSEINYQDLSNIALEVKQDNGMKEDKKKKYQLYVDYNSAQIESFLISDKPYQQLSDHFGLSVDLKFREYSPYEI